MAPFGESVSVIESPFTPFEEGDGYYEDASYYDAYQSQRQVQKRMMVIMASVLVIIAIMALFVLPGETAVVGSGVQPVAAEASEPVVVAAVAPVADAEIAPSALEPATSGGIAAFFTPEVKYWEQDIVRWAAEHDLDPNIVATVMQIESCGNPQAVSVAGARGLFQVMPFHFSGNEDMLDPDTNARRGMNFFNEQLRYTGGDTLLSFAGYNGGYAASGGPYDSWPAETKRYHKWAQGIYADAQSGAAESATLTEWLAAGGGPGCDIAAAALGLR